MTSIERKNQHNKKLIEETNSQVKYNPTEIKGNVAVASDNHFFNQPLINTTRIGNWSKQGNNYKTVDERDIENHTCTKKSLPVLTLPHPGLSQNPRAKDHEELLEAEATEQIGKIINEGNASEQVSSEETLQNVVPLLDRVTDTNDSQDMSEGLQICYTQPITGERHKKSIVNKRLRHKMLLNQNKAIKHNKLMKHNLKSIKSISK